MTIMRPLEYAKKYWEMQVPIFNDDNELVGHEPVRFGKYRLHQGWGQKPPVEPPGLSEFRSKVMAYAYRYFQKKSALQMQVTNVWGDATLMQFKTQSEFMPLLVRAVQAFSGKGSPEDVQLTLQLAARCGVARQGLQQYCDETVDRYSRLGLDCNGFVGNYLRYRNSENKWKYFEPASSNKFINGDMGINSIAIKLGTKPVKDESDLFTPRMHVLAMVNKAGLVIDGGFGPVGHIMIFEAVNSVTKQAIYPPAPKEFLNGKYLWYSGVEATPGVGLSRIAYAVLKIAANGVATVWRSEVKGLINVKMFPVH